MQRCSSPAATLRHRLAASSAHRRPAPMLLHAPLSRTAFRQRGPQLGTHGDTLRRPPDIPEDEWISYTRNKRYRLSHVARIENTEHGTVAPRPCKRCADAGETCMVYTLDGQRWSHTSSCARCRRLARPCSHNDLPIVGWYRDAMRRWASDGRLTHRQRISDLEAKNKELLSEAGKLRMDAAAATAMGEETTALRAELRTAHADLSALRKENEKLRTTAAAKNEATQRENEVLNAQLRAAVRQLEAGRLGLSLDDAVVQGEETLSRAASIKLKRLRTALRGKLSTDKSAQIKARIKRMEQRLKDMGETAAEAESGQASHQELVREEAILRQQINRRKASRKRSRLEQAIKAHRAELDEVQAARERQLEKDLGVVERDQRHANSQVAAAGVGTDSADRPEEGPSQRRRDGFAQLKAQLAEATTKKREPDRMKKENEATVAANAGLKAQLQALASHSQNVPVTGAQSPSFGDLTSQLRAMEAEVNRLRKAVDSLKDLGKQNEALRREVYALRKPSNLGRERDQSSKPVTVAANEQQR